MDELLFSASSDLHLAGDDSFCGILKRMFRKICKIPGQCQVRTGFSLDEVGWLPTIL